MAALVNQTNANTTTSFFSAAGSGGGGGGSGIPLNLSTNNIYVSTISNSFANLGGSNATFQPIFFDQLTNFDNLGQMEIKLRQRATDAGAIQTLRMGVNYDTGAYINSEWDGYINMPMTLTVQDLKINDEYGTNMYVNNLVTQVPSLSTINVQTNTINGQPYVAPSAPVYLSSTSNYSSAFSVGVGSNITLLSYDFPGITAGTYEYTVPISFNTSNATGVTPFILEVYGGSSPVVDSNTTCIFDQKTNDFVFYNLRGQVYTDALNPAIVVSGTNLTSSFDIIVSSFSGAQTALLKKIS